MPDGINGEKLVKKNKQQTVIPSQKTITEDLNKVPLWKEAPKQTGKKKKEAVSEKQSYLDNVILGFGDDNLKLIHIADRKLKNVPKPNFKAYEPPQKFTQRLPSASRDKKTATAEKNKITELKKQGVEDADYCTAREYTALTEYFKGDANKDITSPPDLDNPELREYVNNILSVKIDIASLTDDYLSNHISELVKHVKDLDKLDGYKKRYPRFFESLNVDQSIELETKLFLKESLSEFLTAHLTLHGVELKDKDGKSAGVGLIKTDKNKTKAQKKQEKQQKSDQTAGKRAVLADRILKQDLARAALYTSSSLRSENELEALDRLIVKEGDPRIYAEFRQEILHAYGEMKKLLLLRDDELEKQKSNINKYELAGPGEEKDCRKELAKTNAKLELLTKNIGHYKYFLRCVEGDPTLPVVSKETMDFFEKEKQGSIMDVIRVRMMGDYTAQCIHTAKRLEKQERIAELEKKTGDKKAQAELNKLRKELNSESGEKKMEDPCGKLLEFRNAQKTSETVNLKAADERRSAVMKNRKLKDFAEKYKLKPEWDRTFGTINDPLHAMNEEELYWYAIASHYSPLNTKNKDGSFGSDVPEKVRKETVEKGIMPMLKRFLSVKPGNIMSLKFPEKPDLTDPAFWENYSMLNMGFIMSEFLNIVERWGVKLTDKEIIQLKAFGKTAESLYNEYNNYLSGNIGDPMSFLYDTPDFGKYVNIIHKDVVIKPKQKDPFVEKYHSKTTGEVMPLGGKTVPLKIYMQAKAQDIMVKNFAREQAAEGAELFEIHQRRFEVISQLQKMKDEIENKRKDIMGRAGKKPGEKEKKELQALEKEAGYITEALSCLKTHFGSKDPGEETKAFLIKNGLYVETLKERKAKKDQKTGQKKDLKTDKNKDLKKDLNKDLNKDLKQESGPQKLKKKSVITEKPEIKKDEIKQTGKKKDVLKKGEPLNIIIEEKTEKKEYKKAALKALKNEAVKYNKMALKPVKLVPKTGFHIGITPGFKYESQGTNNCYACSGAALFNQFIANKDGKLAEPFGQMDIRAYVPQCKSYEEFKKLAGRIMMNDSKNPDDDLLSDEDFRQMYDDYLNHLESYTGEGQLETGNIFELGDFFISRRDDVVVNRMTFNTPTAKKTLENGKKKTKKQIMDDDLLYSNQKEVFLDQINRILKTGNLVSILNRIGEGDESYDHYRTIAGIKGTKLKVYDSLKGGKPAYLDIEELLPRKADGNVVEITWLSELKDPKQMQKDFPSLKYDEKEGYSENESLGEPTMESALNLGQTKGTLIKKFTREAEYAAYIPKQGTKNKLAKYDLKPLYGQGKDAVRKGTVNKKSTILTEESNKNEKSLLKEKSRLSVGTGKSTTKKEMKTDESETKKEALKTGKTTTKKEALQTKETTAKKETQQKEKASAKKSNDNTASPEMQNYVRDITAVYNFLGQKMPPLNFTGKVSVDAVDAGCLMASTLYNRAMESIDICLSKPSCFNNSADAKKQLEDTRNKCKDEISIFREKVFEYREMLMISESSGENKKKAPASKSAGKEEKKAHTWYEALHYERAAIYNLNGKDGVDMEKVGERGSNVYKLTRINKDKKPVTVFFEKEDKIGAKSDSQLVRDFLAESDEDPAYIKKYVKPVFEGIIKDAEQKMVGDKNFTEYFIALIENDVESADVINMLITANSNASEALKKIPVLQQLTVGDFILGLAKKIFQRGLADEPKIKNGRTLSDRNVATSRLAEFLGIQNMVCDSKTAYVKSNDKYIKGNIMDNSGGRAANDLIIRANLIGRNVRYSREAINQLFMLQIFDYICGQTDRHHKNFHLSYRDKGKDQVTVTGIRAIDNNMAFGNLNHQEAGSRRRYRRMYANQDYLYAMPLEFLNKVMQLNEETLKFILMDILDKDELSCLWDRIRGVQEDIRKMPGLMENKENGTFRYADKKQNDDSFRQAVVLKKFKDKYGDDKLGQEIIFAPFFVDWDAVDKKAKGK